MTPSLYEWAGGEPAFARLIDCFYDRIEGDELISQLFPGGVTREHRDHVVTKHLELGITAEQRRRFVETMSVAADDAGLPADPEFRSALMACVEWGTRVALQSPQPGADVVRHTSVPRWGWGQAPPYLD